MEEEEEGITVPSFPRPANSFQGSRTLSTGPNSKVIAPIPTSARNCLSRNGGWPADRQSPSAENRDVSTIRSCAKERREKSFCSIREGGKLPTNVNHLVVSSLIIAFSYISPHRSRLQAQTRKENFINRALALINVGDVTPKIMFI